ncbi:hypothetical protein SY83_12550 [Paenibacillus swuensis]|uniref:Uncharacterized protein n=1 Tax=Paenibacillus swuensis TaxID=1178515 RepID=A0A172TJ29_9BACL|nr:hypothetical protein [Paenibacillus swuensis]ANE46966.1 hypothetical protein SY83_12550 [Paenibacillus swuensis]
MLKHLLSKLLHSLLGSKSGHNKHYRPYKHSSSDYKRRPTHFKHSSSDFKHSHRQGHKYYKNRYGSSS